MFAVEGDAHVKLATAVEYIHTATLLHDDVIDESLLRRGKETANHIWGNKSSILVGDFLLSQSFKLMVSANNMQALGLLANTAASITESEIWQLELIKKIDLSDTEYIRLVTGKTALLFAAACAVGAILTCRPQHDIDNLYNFGLNLGICFQIVDDILDYTATSNAFGKIQGNDIREGKITLPFIFAYKDATLEQKNSLESLLANHEANLSKLNNILEQTDAIAKSHETACHYARKALEYLAKPEHNFYAGILRELAQFLPNRIY
jgi:octaprenyl-diphosphate synthase